MKIDLNTSIHFQAHRLKYKPQVVKRIDEGKYKPEKVSLIEIDLDNPNDIKAMKQLSNEYNNYFINEMADEAEYYAKHRTKFIDFRFFAVTTQKDNFEKLNPKDVLSFCEIESTDEDNMAYVELIISNAEMMNNPQYKRCGTALLDSLKYYYSCIGLDSIPDAKPFYIRNGFYHPSGARETHLMWKDGE